MCKPRETIRHHGPPKDSGRNVHCRHTHITLPLSGHLWGVTLPSPVLLGVWTNFSRGRTLMNADIETTKACPRAEPALDVIGGGGHRGHEGIVGWVLNPRGLLGRPSAMTKIISRGDAEAQRKGSHLTRIPWIYTDFQPRTSNQQRTLTSH